MEIPFYDKKINDFCEQVLQMAPNVNKYESYVLNHKYYLGKNGKSGPVCKAKSFYKIVCDILNEKEDNVQVFLFYLMLSNQKDSVKAIKTMWVMNRYLCLSPDAKS